MDTFTTCVAEHFLEEEPERQRRNRTGEFWVDWRGENYYRSVFPVPIGHGLIDIINEWKRRILKVQGFEGEEKNLFI